VAVSTVSERHVAGAALVVSATLAAGLWTGAAAVQAARASTGAPYRDLEAFAEALQTIEQRHVSDVSTASLIEGAIRGMAQTLDAHSTFLTARERAALQDHTEGGDTGVGARLTHDGAHVVIDSVVPAGPADLAGARPGDVVLAIEGEPVTHLADAEAALRGPRDTVVALTLQRSAAVLEISPVRDTVLERSVRADRLPGGIAHVHIDAFRRRSASELRDQLDALESEAPLSGIILDLRGNPGGLLDEAVVVVDTFADTGAILEVRGKASRLLETHNAKPESSDRFDPLVVLVDERSASASEIVAGALQDLGRATVVGTPTYGKGSVQKLFLFEDGSGLKLTIAKYHLPSGRGIPDGDGLSPDLQVSPPRQPREDAADFRARLSRAALTESERDTLLAAFDTLGELTEPVPPPGMSVAPDERLESDPVLRAAVEAIHDR